jgi:uncharacterized membrane protein YphA (DoxX/SURF4 family)
LPEVLHKRPSGRTPPDRRSILPEEDGPLRNISFKYGVFVIVALVLLRLSIGWHFFKEGAKKFTPDFSAESFLVISHGPLEGLYKGMVPDAFGRIRLDRDQTRDQTIAIWDDFLTKAAARYGFNDDQRKLAQQQLDSRRKQLDWYLAENGEEIDKYFMELNQLEQAKRDRTTREVAYRRDWIESKERELRGKVKRWLNDLARLSKSFADDVVALADKDQQRLGRPAMYDAGSMWLINTMVKWTVILVGIFLVLGLFTRFWSIIGVGFLCSVISSQWPGWHGAEPTYYQVVELCGLLVLVATNAGRFAGLDFFVDTFYQGFLAKVKQGKSHGS